MTDKDLQARLAAAERTIRALQELAGAIEDWWRSTWSWNSASNGVRRSWSA